MTYLDTVLLDATEWACRKFQLLTGRTNVWLAIQLTNLSVIMYFVLWAGVYFLAEELAPRLFLAVFCVVLVYALTQTIFKVSIEESENHAYRRVANGFRNPRRIRDAALRTSFLTVSILLSYPIFFVYRYLEGRAVRIALLSYLLVVLTTVLLYLLACDPLPPCVGKVTEWLRRAVPSRLAATRPADR
jgi:hypothetical protein